MRILKKSLALLIAFTMVASLIVVNVSAAEADVEYVMEITPATVKTGNTVTLSVYLRDAGGADSVVVNAGAYVINYDPEVFEATDVKVSGNAFNTNRNATKKTISAIKNVSNGDESDNVTIAKDTPIQTVTLKALKTVAADEINSFSFNAGATASKYEGENKAYVVKQDDTASVTIKVSFAATQAEAVDPVTSYPIGTDVAAALASTDVTVKNADGTNSEEGYKAVWVCDDADCDLTVPGTHTFTGTVTPAADPEAAAAGWTGDLKTAPVTVTLTALTTGKVTASMDAATIKAEKEAREVTDDELKALFADATFAVAANGIEDTMTAASWAVDKTTLNITEVGTTAKVTATLNTKSAAEKFEFAEAPTVDFTVTVVAAEIEGGAIEIESVSINKAPVVTVTIPASEFVDDGTEEKEEIVLDENGETVMEQKKDEDGNLVYEEDGETPVMVEKTETVTVAVPNNEVVVTIGEKAVPFKAGYNAGEAVVEKDNKGTEDTADDTVAITVEFADKLSTLGYANNDDIVISATVNGAAIITGYEQETDEEGNPVVDAEGNPVMVPVTNITATAKKPVSTGSGTGIKPSTKPGTDKPGTETPGTDAPDVVPTDPDKVPQTEGPFADVAADHWAAASIAQLKEAGVVNGSGDGNYTPEADITRAEFTKMVVGVMGLEAAVAEVAFEDCTAEDWFTPYVAAAVEAGLVNGVSETEFAPNATITREQAFAIIGRAIDAEATTAVAFTDAADIDEYAAPYVALLVELGIVNGYEDNTIRPDANITRAEAAKILAGFMDKLNADAEVLPETEEVVEEATEEVVDEK